MSLKLAFIGSGQIAVAHLNGVAALQKHALANASSSEPRFELVAMADPRTDARELLANAAAEKLGQRPKTFSDYREMLDTVPLDAAALLVPHHLHWSIARDCLDAGLHLQVQKPIAITIAEGRRMIDYARQKSLALVVSEPSILGRGTRALIEALRSGEVIGAPTMLLDYAITTLGGGFFMGTPWRHLKGLAGAGWFLDHGVHRTHWFLETLGSVESALGCVRTFEPRRSDEKHGPFEVDTEDCAMTALQFASGALGHFLVASAGQGSGFGSVRLYGTHGVADLSGGTVQKQDGAVQRLDEITAPYRDENLPSDAMGHSFLELYQFITQGRQPISSGERALEALGVIYACMESALTNKSVRVAEILTGATHVYEDSIEAARSAWAAVEPAKVS